MADVFSGLIHREATKNSTHGLKVAWSAPQVSHLLFADDSLLFTRENASEGQKILQVLATYQQASGQMVNLDKSEVSFSQNVPIEERNMICGMMGVTAVESHTWYLRFPVPFGRSKKAIFGFVIDHVRKKIMGWKQMFLSRAGKETLMKAVARAIPNYIMSCYKIPEDCCKDIDSILAKFLWELGEDSRKVHWLSG